MKQVFALLLLLFLFSKSEAQVGSFNQLNAKELTVGEKFYLPVFDTVWTPKRPGALTLRPQDSLVYRFNGNITGKKWDLFSLPSYDAGVGIKIDGSTIRWADSVSTGHVVNFFNGSIFDIISGTSASNYSRLRISVNGTEQLVTQTDGTTSDILLATSGISLRRYGVAVSRMLKVASTIDFSNSAGTLLTNSFGADSSIHYKKLVYGANYRSLFTPFTLVDKGYVDSLAGTIGGSGADTTFSSIANLKAYDATSVTNGTYIQLSGYYTPNDGGGGLFVWNSSSTATDNGGTIIKSTPVTTGRWLRVYNGNINTNWFGAIPNGSRIVTTNLQAALDMTGGIETPYHNRRLIIDDRLIIKSNTTWHLDPLDTIYEATGNNTILIRNENMDSAADYSTTDHDITITGGIWDANWVGNPGTNYFSDLLGLQSDKTSPARGVRGNLAFIGVSRLKLLNMRIVNPVTNGIQIFKCMDWEAGFIDLVRTENTISDAIHIGPRSSNFYVHDFTGSTGDDFIALIPWEWVITGPNGGLTNGPVTKGFINNIHPTLCKWAIIKIYTGTEGATVCNVDDVTISNVKGSSTHGAVLILSADSEPDQWTPSHVSGEGEVTNVIFDNVSANTVTAISVYGAVVTLAANADNLTFKNIVVDSTYKPVSGHPWLNQKANYEVKNIVVTNFNQTDSLGWNNMIDFNGKVGNLVVDKMNTLGSGGFAGDRARDAIRLLSSDSAVVKITNSNFIGTYGAIESRGLGSTITLANNFFQSTYNPVYLTQDTRLNLIGNNFKSNGLALVYENSGSLNITTAGNTTDGAGATFSKNSGSARWNGIDLSVDASLITPTAYDVIKNSNSGVTPLGINQYSGSAWVPIGAAGNPAGSNTQIQYNNGGAFGASANLTFNGTKLSIPGSTSSNSAEFGTFGIQSYATNNGWLSDNLYFDGTNFKYRLNGYGVLSYFSVGGWQLLTAPSGTAGATATTTSRLFVSNTGEMGIGTASPAASAKLEIVSTTQGFLLPRMTTAQRDAISSPATGLHVYDNTVNEQSVYDGTRWVYTPKTLASSATLDFDLTAVNYEDLTITVTGAVDGDAVVIGVPNGAAVADVTFFGWVSAANTVTVRASRVGGGAAANPASGTFKARVIK